MAELADAADSKSAGLRPLGVRLPLPAPVEVIVPHFAAGMLAAIPVSRAESSTAYLLSCRCCSAVAMAQIGVDFFYLMTHAD